MKKTKQIEADCALVDILNTIVCEKSDLIWTVPYTPGLHEHIVQELLVQHPLSSN